jgi:hypothetical protein
MDRASLIETMVGSSPVVKLITGAVPVTIEDDDPGVVIATISLPSDWADVQVAGGVVSVVKVGTWSGTASGSGVPTHFKICATGGDPCYAMSTVTGSGGGGFMIISTSSLASGNTVTITSFSILQSNQ